MNKKLYILIGVAIFLLAFTKKKKLKGSIEVGPLAGNNMYAKAGSILFNSPYANQILVNFRGGEYLNFVKEDIDDYFVEYVRPGGQTIRGYISKTDVTIK